MQTCFKICESGHLRVVPVGIEDDCEICIAESTYGAKCETTCYKYSQGVFILVCSAGHRFLAKGPHHCPTCAYGLKIDGGCVNMGAKSRLRAHCTKMRHNPKCGNDECASIREVARHRGVMAGFSRTCRDFIPCDQDFYIMPFQIKSRLLSLNCNNDHRWEPSNFMYITAVRYFEVWFDARFDDRLGAEYVTGYNADCKMAFTYLGTAAAARSAAEYCAIKGITFIHFDQPFKRGVHLAYAMMEKLKAAGQLELDAKYAAKKLRAIIKEMDDAHKLFKDRCVFPGAAESAVSAEEATGPVGESAVPAEESVVGESAAGNHPTDAEPEKIELTV